MGEDSRKNRVLSLNAQLAEAHGGQLGAGGPARDPPGFWEGALQNEELATAHSKFKTDIEVHFLFCRPCFHHLSMVVP